MVPCAKSANSSLPRGSSDAPKLKRPLLLLASLAGAAALAIRAQSPASAEPVPGPPAKNWALPLFTDKEGFHSMTLRGTEARAVGPDRFDVVDLNITVFSGDAAAHVDSVLLSPAASFFQNDKRASGDKSVRVIRDDLNASGDRWTYDYAQKKVSLDGRVRIVFQAELKDLLQ